MAFITSGGDRKSMSATHMGIMSLDLYFSHFRLAVPRRSTGVSKSYLSEFFISCLPPFLMGYYCFVIYVK
jgi:hypothetical protein